MKFHNVLLVPPELSRVHDRFNGHIFWCAAKALSDNEGCFVKEVFHPVVNNCMDLVGSILNAGKRIFFQLETNLVLISDWI